MGNREKFLTWLNDCPFEWMYHQRGMTMSNTEKFWAWIDQCPDGVYVNHDFTDDEDDQKIYVFGFAVPKENDDE